MLDVNSSFPKLTARDTTGQTIRLPEALAGGWGIILGYRANW